jgi:hypothetical protein
LGAGSAALPGVGAARFAMPLLLLLLLLLFNKSLRRVLKHYLQKKQQS